jgi:hypothetical protein
VLEVTPLGKKFLVIFLSTALALIEFLATVISEDHSLRSLSWSLTERHLQMSALFMGLIKFMTIPELARAVATIISRILKLKYSGA